MLRGGNRDFVNIEAKLIRALPAYVSKESTASDFMVVK
jgi:hypothetical protein